jgi:16S rRNA (guanine527-N7)-methyltransferase
MNKDEVQYYLKNKLKFSHDDLEKLTLFHEELIKFNTKYNLISRSTVTDIWNRHILDSAQVVKFIRFEDNKSLSDMGSGAGFPGLILSIFNKNNKFHVKLHEKSNIKCDFLQIIREKLNLNYDILGDYKFDLIASDYVVSRAFKKLEEVLRISREIIGVNHKLIILKGKNAENEINKLHQPLSFIYNLERSVTDRDSKILIVDIKKN